jgi:hypothetical protein
MSGGHTGYHYNPYNAGWDYPYGVSHGTYDGYYGYSPYGAAHTYVGTVSNAYGPVVETPVVEEEVAEELTSGEIAGIVIGSVIGFLLLVLLACLCMRNRRNNMPPEMMGMGQMPPPGHMNTSMSDAGGNATDAPDILDYTGGKKPPAAMDGTPKPM